MKAISIIGILVLSLNSRAGSLDVRYFEVYKYITRTDSVIKYINSFLEKKANAFTGYPKTISANFSAYAPLFKNMNVDRESAMLFDSLNRTTDSIPELETLSTHPDSEYKLKFSKIVSNLLCVQLTNYQKCRNVNGMLVCGGGKYIQFWFRFGIGSKIEKVKFDGVIVK